MLPLVTAAEMRSIEAGAIARGISSETLMERAARALADRVLKERRQRAVILVGPGKNGGDGALAGRFLAGAGCHVSLYTYRRPDTTPFEGEVIASGTDTQFAELGALLHSNPVVVDALLGTGQNRPPERDLAALLGFVNTCQSSLAGSIAVDVPTGVHSDTGAVVGAAFRAGTTLCMGYAKFGCVMAPGCDYAGFIEVVDLELPPNNACSVRSFLTDAGDIATALPVRDTQANKGTGGHLLVVGGSRSYLGAPALVALAAYRVGCGLVELAVPVSIQASVAAHTLEAIYRPLPETDGHVSAASREEVAQAISKSAAMVFGPGLGLSTDAIELTRATRALIGAAAKPLVVDADGLNALAQIRNWWEIEVDAVLTPHPGEMSRLTGLSVEEIQGDRVSTAVRFAAKWNQVLVLKGARTVIASPDGRVAVNPTGGPNLATAGTGDVLSGAIGGLLAQGIKSFESALAGVFLHGLAGDILAEQVGDSGTLAGDLPAKLALARYRILNTKEQP